MSNDDILQILIPLGIVLCLGFGFFMWGARARSRLERRIARATNRKAVSSGKGLDTLSLRRKSQDNSLPFISNIIRNFPTQAALRMRLERAGLSLPADIYATASAGTAVVIFLLAVLFDLPPILGALAGFVIGIVIPYWVIKHLGASRVKKFILQFPDAIDFIVRGLRAGLPVTESMNSVGTEMREPIKSIFASIGESIRLGISVEKAMQEMAKKLDSTEFNFFTTCITLQRETGGNLSEILSNLSDVLRQRFMMRMKIKAMSSEAFASAVIVGALPLVVVTLLYFITPDYLDPLIHDHTGNIAAGGAAASLLVGIFTMIKMGQFEI